MLLIALSLSAVFRFVGFFTEPSLAGAEIHAVAGEPARVVRPIDRDRPLVVTWNIERGIRFEPVVAMLQRLDADVILLQEVDRFCRRSGYRDVARDLAHRLSMNWIAAGEFQEIGEGRRGAACVSGQAILSRGAIDHAAVIRFTNQSTAKWRLNPAQPRRGGRIALRARAGGVTAYSLHLESGSSDRLRAQQLNDVLVDSSAEVERPVIIGGDFNNLGGPHSDMFLGLGLSAFVNTFEPGLSEPVPPRRPIDWIFTKGVRGARSIVRADEASDHDPVVVALGTESGDSR